MSVDATGHPLLIRVSGRDRPSLTRDLLQLLGEAGAVLEDMEQLVVRERLTLDVLVRLDGADDGVVRDVLFWGFTHGMKVDFERVASTSSRASIRAIRQSSRTATGTVSIGSFRRYARGSPSAATTTPSSGR